MHLFQRYHVWDLLLSSECLLMGQKNTPAALVASPSKKTSVSSSLQQLVLITYSSVESYNISVSIECRQKLLDLFYNMISKAASDNRVDSVALEVRNIVLAIERAVSSPSCSDVLTIQLTHCLHRLMERNGSSVSSGSVQIGLTNSHMLPQLISCAAKHLQDTINPKLWTDQPSASHNYYHSQGSSQEFSDTEAHLLENDNINLSRNYIATNSTSPLGVPIRPNYFPPPISTSILSPLKFS